MSIIVSYILIVGLFFIIKYFCASIIYVMLKKTFQLLFLTFAALVQAQNYTPLDTLDKSNRDAFIIKYKLRSEKFDKEIRTKTSGKTGKELEQIYREFQKDFIKELGKNSFSFNTEFNNNLNTIINEIRKNNSNIPEDLQVLVARDNSPNAYCMGDGTFVVNMGLYYLLENEDQIASVMCHELGHYLLEHTTKSQLRRINQNEQDKSKVKEIKRQRYNRSANAFSLFKEKAYETGEYKRKAELQADSLGYKLLKETKYKKLSFINALELLAKYDTLKSKDLKVEAYKKYFSIPDQAFKESWLKKEDFSSYDYSLYKEKLDKDSLKSHPEIVDRVRRLKELFPELSEKTVEIKPTDSFNELSKIAAYERLPNLYASEDYGVGIYLALLNLERENDPDYYKQWMGKCFYKIYEARKNYTLNRYLDRIDPKNQSDSYQQFLSFMWNLSLEEIKNFTEFYNNKSS